jgi:hypothetical protein
MKQQIEALQAEVARLRIRGLDDDNLLIRLLPDVTFCSLVDAAFVAAGFEHSIANCYFIPIGLFIKAGAPESFWASIGKTAADFPRPGPVRTPGSPKAKPPRGKTPGLCPTAKLSPRGWLVPARRKAGPAARRDRYASGATQ